MDSLHAQKYFPLSARYNENWVKRNSLGENVLYNLESLCEILELRPGMKILDLGSGKAVSAIFLAHEFKTKVWAVDAKTCPSENYKRIMEMKCEEHVLPLKVDARKLPFPEEFFDIIIAADSFMYFGTDMGYTEYITRYLKKDGQIGIVDICYIDLNRTKHPGENYFTKHKHMNFVYSLDWWFDLWNSSKNLKVNVAEVVPENDIIIKEYIRDNKFSDKPDLLAEELENDQENVLKIFRMAARKSMNQFNGLSYF